MRRHIAGWGIPNFVHEMGVGGRQTMVRSVELGRLVESSSRGRRRTGSIQIRRPGNVGIGIGHLIFIENRSIGVRGSQHWRQWWWWVIDVVYKVAVTAAVERIIGWIVIAKVMRIRIGNVSDIQIVVGVESLVVAQFVVGGFVAAVI